MTESDPRRTTPTAGVAGAHRRDMTQPLDDPGMSLNSVPRRATATQKDQERFEGPEEIRADIAAAREELVATLDTLIARVDVPARLRERTEDVVRRVSAAAHRVSARMKAADGAQRRRIVVTAGTVTGAIVGAVAVVARLRAARPRRPRRLR